MQKLFAYVDETGIDTEADFFIVGIVIFDSGREIWHERLERYEIQSGKGIRKWTKSRAKQRLEYMCLVFNHAGMQGRLRYAVFNKDGTPYLDMVVNATCRAVADYGTHPYKATVFIDGLQKSQIRSTATELRRCNSNIKKARGVKKDENNAFIRLADALCGLVRLSMSNNKARQLLKMGVTRGVVVQG